MFGDFFAGDIEDLGDDVFASATGDQPAATVNSETRALAKMVRISFLYMIGRNSHEARKHGAVWMQQTPTPLGD